MSDWSETHLLALILARSLDFELPHTRRLCLDDISSSVLANEVRPLRTIVSILSLLYSLQKLQHYSKVPWQNFTF